MFIMSIHLLTVIILVINLPKFSSTSNSMTAIQSPCPKVFHYRFDSNNWNGEISLRKPPSPGVVHLKVILSLHGRPPTDYIGEIELSNCDVLRNCNNLLYKIKFPNGRITVPRIAQILVNGHLICLGPVDRGVLVTLIQLEHIRNSTFVVDDNISKESTVREDFYQNVTRISDNCGQSDVPLGNKQFIPKGSWPWLAAVYFHNITTLEYRCGGTLISEKHVISAAHCFYTPKHRYTPAQTIIALGKHNLSVWIEKNSILTACSEIHIHPDYDETGASYDADLALILLKESLTFTEYIRPICLWSESTKIDDIVGNHGMIIGWGHNYIRPLSPIPKKSTGIIVSQDVCSHQSNEKDQVLSYGRIFCASNINGMSPCNGDSGVGFAIKREEKWILRGIVSISLPADATNGLCNLNELIIYTDIAQFLDWIYLFLD